MSKINMGIIGCGTHAKHHAENYGEDFVTYGVWDPNPKAMEDFEGIKYPSIEALLADKEIQSVIICSPDEYHLEQIEMSLRAGKHVFCEKPLLVPGQDMARLEAAFDLAKKEKLIVTSCHPRRYDKPFMWLKETLDNFEFPVEFGGVLSFDFDFSYHEPSSEWKQTRSLLLDHLNHEVDLMNFLFGIEGFNAWKLHDSFDFYEVAGKRDNGITFHFRGTRRLVERKYPEWCRVRFEEGEIVLDMMMGLAHMIDHNSHRTTNIPNLAIDYDGRLEGVMFNFAKSQILPEKSDCLGYLSRSEMLMNTEAGIILQEEGIQRVNVR